MIELNKNTEFEQIYAKFKDKVAQYIYGKIPNKHDAEDLISDVFVKVFKGFSGFDETKASLSTWIYRITQNTVSTIIGRRSLFTGYRRNFALRETLMRKCLTRKRSKVLRTLSNNSPSGSAISLSCTIIAGKH